MPDELTTYEENTWCPGCGNFGIFNAFKMAVKRLEEEGISRNKVVITAGIGCHAKIFDYLNLSGLYSIHGRGISTAQGMKLANHELIAVAFAGDGDALGEGISHTIFAAKRNANITAIIHDNGVYGLTTGQFTPTSHKGFIGPSTPKGSIEDPLNPLKLMLISGATFVARGYSARIKELTDIFYEGMIHKGFSFIDVLQPCVSFNDTYKLYNSIVEPINKPANSIEEALNIVNETEKLPVGIIYKTDKPVYDELLQGSKIPEIQKSSREERIKNIHNLLLKSI
jgi:2-oxoglutarate ferredoxin oxidoreductase subunit beta